MTEATIHGGLSSHLSNRTESRGQRNIRSEKEGYSRAETEGLSQPVKAVSLMRRIRKSGAYVGKNCTKLRPNSCAMVMIAKMPTFGSLIASIRPLSCLLMGVSA